VHLRKHLVVSPDHGDNDGTLECIEFLVIHPEGSLQFAESRIPPVIRQQREIKAELANRECLVQLFLRTIGVIEQRLRVGHKRFCNGAHVQIPPCGCTGRLANCGEFKARLRRGAARRGVAVPGPTT